MNKKKIFKFIFGLIFIAFIISYVIEESGYYEYNLRNKTVMTKESMERFEKDLKDGKDVLMEDYVVNTTNTNKVSFKVNSFLKKGIEGMFKVASKLVED